MRIPLLIGLVVCFSATLTFAQGTGWNVQDSRGASGIASVINYSSSGGSSAFGSNAAFPNGTGNNFSLTGYGYMLVPTAGDYTFAVNQDDQIFVGVSKSGAPAVISDTGCCGTSTYTLTLDAGLHFTNFAFREFSGGESAEIAATPGTGVPFGIPPFSLVNSSGNALQVASNPLEFTDKSFNGFENPVAVGMTFGQGPQGFNVEVQNASASPGVVGGTVDNIAEGQALITGGGPPEATDTPATIKYNRSVTTSPATNPFPAGTAGDNFALRATAFLDVLDPDNSDDIFFYVSSDDGFELKINGVTEAIFTSTTGDSNTLSGLVTVTDGDLLELVMFEAGGGQAVTLARDLDGNLGTTHDRFLIGDPASGVLAFLNNDFDSVVATPEPSTVAIWIVLAIGFVGFGYHRAHNK